MTPFTPNEMLSLLRPLSESAYLGMKQVIAERDAARAEADALRALLRESQNFIASTPLLERIDAALSREGK